MRIQSLERRLNPKGTPFTKLGVTTASVLVISESVVNFVAAAGTSALMFASGYPFLGVLLAIYAGLTVALPPFLVYFALRGANS